MDLHIDGLITGIVSTKGRVCVEPGAAVHGTISAREIHVAGFVKGTLEAAEKVVLLPAADVQATLRARILEIHPGAQFEETGQSDDSSRPRSSSGNGQGGRRDRPHLAPVPPGQTPEDLSALDASSPTMERLVHPGLDAK